MHNDGRLWPRAIRADGCPDPSLCARRALAHTTAPRTVNLKHGGLATVALIFAQPQFVRELALGSRRCRATGSSASVRPGDIPSRARRGLMLVIHQAPRQYK